MAKLIVGPWLGEVGHELLYWIPYLRKQVEKGRFDPADATAVSRGGVRDWYRGIAAGYVEVFDHISPAVFRTQNEVRERMTGKMKQLSLFQFDTILVEAVGEVVGSSQHLHPGEMFRLFEPCWSEGRSIQHIFDHTVHLRMSLAERHDLALPDGYAAIKFYRSKCFPDSGENRCLIERVVAVLQQRGAAPVSLFSGLQADEHRDFVPEEAITVEGWMTAQNNLGRQAQIVAQAESFYGTYGGFSYLAPYLGVPSYSFYSERNFVRTHLEVAQEVFRALSVSFNVTKVGEWNGYRFRET